MAANEPWETLLLAWLHDPVDKAADIRGHVARALRYAATVMGREVTPAELKGGLADQLASVYERLPMPDAKDRYEELGVLPERGRLQVVHPLSAEREETEIGLNEGEVQGILRGLVGRELSAKQRFLTLWRRAPEELSKRWPGLRRQPAETRCPDHTLWQHLDTTAAMAWASKGGRGQAALLSFKIGPVQPFIAAARSLRDLLSGSYLLSTLVFAAIERVVESCGPTALIYPALRGVPLMDLWLGQQGVEIERPGSEALSRPSVPHQFLALIPYALAEGLKREVEEAARSEWLEIAGAVRRELKRQLDQEWPGWDRLWEAQVGSYFDVRATAYRVGEADHAALLGEEVVKRFEPLRKLGWSGDAQPGSWQCAVEVSARVMEATRRIRHIPRYGAEGEVGQKCTLLGTYEQMGPAKLSESRRFFKALAERYGPSYKESDRLCAVSLTKRFAFPHYFKREVGVDPEDYKFPDTRQLCKRGGKGCVYYALLAMDGDEMGKWLSGEKSPLVRELLHPKIKGWLEKQGGAEEALALKRPVSPGLHAALSEALNRFATEIVPEVVKKQKGVVIYAGGDDVLAALPVNRALECARELRRKFSSWEVLGERASASAGLVVAHEQEDLRYVVGMARRAEKVAKRGGRNRLTVGALRRSGEHSFATCRWDYVEKLIRGQGSFQSGTSDRWTHQLRRQVEVLKELPKEAFEGELRRLLERSEKRDKDFVEDWEKFAELHGSELGKRQYQEFLTLCQTASFMARGRD
jgi:CRISPR-associated protein Cmr2